MTERGIKADEKANRRVRLWGGRDHKMVRSVLPATSSERDQRDRHQSLQGSATLAGYSTARERTA